MNRAAPAADAVRVELSADEANAVRLAIRSSIEAHEMEAGQRTRRRGHDESVTELQQDAEVLRSALGRFSR